MQRYPCPGGSVPKGDVARERLFGDAIQEYRAGPKSPAGLPARTNLYCRTAVHVPGLPLLLVMVPDMVLEESKVPR